MSRKIPQQVAEKVHQYRWLLRVGQWGGLFAGLLLAIYIATQSRQAPQLILMALLYVLTINFSVPLSHGGIGLVPIVAVTSLFVIGPESAVSLLIASVLLAELVRPLWDPIWESAGVNRLPWLQRLGAGLGGGIVNLLSLTAAGIIYSRMGGELPLTTAGVGGMESFIGMSIGYGIIYFICTLMLWRLFTKRALRQFMALSTLAVGFLSHPFALLGGTTFTYSGMPAFVIFCFGVMGSSLVVWLSWQRRLVLEQQLGQFSVLNSSSELLRETLDLSTVLRQIQQQIITLIPADRFFIVLVDSDGSWERPSLFPDLDYETLSIDDFTRWVAENGRPLDLDKRNMHFATQHMLIPPEPLPDAWFGMPLTAAEQVIGVMVLQRFLPNPPFRRWDRELLLAIAGQASAAIQNASLYSETVRLYNLTDETLARRVKQLQALLNAMQEGVLMIETNGHIVLVNSMAADLLQQPEEDLKNKNLRSIPVPSLGYADNELIALFASLLSGQVPKSRHTIFKALIPKQNSLRTIERVEAPVMAGNQQVMGWLMLFRDITEEQELNEMRNDLTRMIVHDLRNPLTTLTSTIDLVESQLQVHSPTSLAKVDDLLDDIRHGSSTMLDMVDSLMDINRMEAGQVSIEAEAMHLTPLVEHVVKRLHPLAIQKNIELQFEYPENLPAVWADEEMVRRILINLFDNALKFTPAGGMIRGRLQIEPPPSSSQQEPGVRCTINDSGPGIPAELQNMIFERFTRTNSGGAQVRGTGLGLTFCKLAVEAHGGRIWVENVPDGGSCFVFTLPGVPVFTFE